MKRLPVLIIGVHAARGCRDVAVASRLQAAGQSPLVERVGDTGFIQLQSPSFAQLDAEAEGAGLLADAGVDRDRSDHLRPALALRAARRSGCSKGSSRTTPACRRPTFAKIREYALLFWANRGNHNEITAQKFLPSFTFEELQDAALKAQAAGAFKTRVRPTCRRSRPPTP